MRFGILQRYPNLRRLSCRVADFVALCRPFTLLGAFIAGFSLDIAFSGSLTPHAILVGFTLAFLQAGGQVMNQAIADEVAIDRLNEKVYRPTVDGRISLTEAKIVSLLLYGAGIWLAFNLSAAYGLFSLLITFFAVAYTVPPFRVKRFFLLSNIWQGIARGMLPAVYVSLAYPEYMSLAIPFGVVLGVWVTGAQSTKDFGDERGDRAYGIKSLPVVLGWDAALILMSLLMFMAFCLLNLFIPLRLLPESFAWLNVLLIPSTVIIYGLAKGMKFKYGENNASWIAFYGTLSLFYILPTLLI